MLKRVALKLQLQMWQVALFLVLLSTDKVFGQGPEGPVEESEPDYVLSYALFILCVGLALFSICRMGKRSQNLRRLE